MAARPYAESLSTSAGGALPSLTGSETLDELRAAVEALRIRLNDAEAENAKLRVRNRELEGGSASDGGSSVHAAAAAVLPTAATSPPEARKTRMSQEDVHPATIAMHQSAPPPLVSHP